MNSQAQATLFAEILKPENRPAPQGLWALMRREPVSRQEDGTWVVTGYEAVRSLISDPRMSSDQSKAGPDATLRVPPNPPEMTNPFRPFINVDPPDHERARRSVMSHFGPPTQPRKVLNMEAEITRLTGELLDRTAASTRMDVVDDFSYPLPMAMISSLLGVPASDEVTFKRWFSVIINQRLSGPDATEAEQQAFGQAFTEIMGYMMQLAQQRRTKPGDDLISGMASDTNGLGAVSDADIAGTGALLMGAGHETTVNAVSSAILLFLRNPEQMQLLKDRPELVAGAFEEVLRLEPPITFRDRNTLGEITVGGVTIPKGVTVQLSLAAANRDPARFTDPDVFDPQRPDNQHLSFLGGPHYCFGAPMARLEGRLMLTEWLRRVQGPRLVVDPPPYRDNAGLRGPLHLLVDHDGIAA